MSTPPSTGVMFSDFSAPSLRAGTFTIAATQALAGRSIEGLPPTLEARQAIRVEGPRFALHAKDVHALHPPAHSVLDCASELPYVVFTRRTLPWERALDDGNPASPWMALLVFAESEVPEAITTSVEDYCATGTGATAKTHVRIQVDAVPDAVKQDLCRCVDVPLRTFKLVVPRRADLSWLAHGREVAMADKAGVDMPHAGAFSIVLANRLPLPGRRSVAHLISLEGCHGLLDRDVAPGDETLAIRLISLASWSFTCAKGGDDFASIVERLITSDPGSGARVPRDLLYRLPSPAGTDEAARKRLEAGYVPLPYLLMDGRDSIAWYRGPLVPTLSPDPEPEREPLPSASAAMVFDDATGVFDQSHAAAWQAGRLLALADSAFSVALMDLRAKLRHDLDVAASAYDAFVQGRGWDHGDALELALDESALAPRILARLDLGDGATRDRLAFLDEPIAVPASALDMPPEDATPPAPGQSAEPTAKLERHLHELAAPQRSGSAFETSTLVSKLGDKRAQEVSAIVEWLARLSVTSLPIHHVVPHPGLLPAESLRVFAVDEEWWRSLVDGALSLGIHTELDERVGRVVRDHLRSGRQDSKRAERAGVLLRSRLVEAWAGLELVALRGGARLEPVTTARLGADVLLFLFAACPDAIHVEQPKEGLRFVPGTRTDVPLRDVPGGPPGVVDVPRLLESVKGRNGVDGRAAGSGTLAAQLVATSERFVIEPGGSR